jgi:hypothetical protein
MSYNITKLTDAINAIRLNIKDIQDDLTLPFIPDSIQEHAINLTINFEALTMMLVAMSATPEIQGVLSEKPDRHVGVGLNGQFYDFNTFERHVLYSIDEGKQISPKYELWRATAQLAQFQQDELITVNYDPDPIYSLTELGKRAVAAFRAAHS